MPAHVKLPRDQFSSLTPGPKGEYTVRIFVDDSTGEWRPLPLSAMDSLYQGEHRFPESGGKVVRIASAYIVKRLDGSNALTRIDVSTLELNGEGGVDQESLTHSIQRKLDGVEDGSTWSASANRIHDVVAIAVACGFRSRANSGSDHG